MHIDNKINNNELGVNCHKYNTIIYYLCSQII